MSKPFHWAGAAHLILAAAAQLGVEKARVLERAELNPGDIPPSLAHIQWAVLKRLTAAALELTGEPGLGLLAGKLAGEHPQGIARAYCAQLASPRTAQAFAYEQVFPRLMNLVRFRMEEREEWVLGLGETISSAEPAVEAHLHLFLAMHVDFYRGVFGDRTEIDHLAVRSTLCGDASHLSELAGCRVLTGQEGDWVAVPFALIDRPMPLATPWLREQLRPQMEAFLRMLDEGKQSTLAVRSEVERALGSGLPVDLDRVAERLALRPRTLRARLVAEHTTFTAVLDEVRKEHALRLVAGRGVKLAAVAAQIGFSDSAVFTRAFRRWTGCTPTDWQARTAGRHLDSASAHLA